jgi:hypothetical protein
MNENKLTSLKDIRIQMEALIHTIADHRDAHGISPLLTEFLQRLMDTTNDIWSDECETNYLRLKSIQR